MNPNCDKVLIDGQWVWYCPPTGVLTEQTREDMSITKDGSTIQPIGGNSTTTTTNQNNTTGTPTTTTSTTDTTTGTNTDAAVKSGMADFNAKMKTRFGMCWFPWLLLIIAVILAAFFLFYRKNKQ